MIIGQTEDGEYIEAMCGGPEERFKDMLKTCPEIRLELLKSGKLEPNPEKRKQAIIEAEKEIRAKRVIRLKARIKKLNTTNT